MPMLTIRYVCARQTHRRTRTFQHVEARINALLAFMRCRLMCGLSFSQANCQSQRGISGLSPLSRLRLFCFNTKSPGSHFPPVSKSISSSLLLFFCFSDSLFQPVFRKPFIIAKLSFSFEDIPLRSPTPFHRMIDKPNTMAIGLLLPLRIVQALMCLIVLILSSFGMLGLLFSFCYYANRASCPLVHIRHPINLALSSQLSHIRTPLLPPLHSLPGGRPSLPPAR